MCGRFLLHEPPKRYAALLQARLGDGLEAQFRPSWNVPPTRRILGAVENEDGIRTLDLYRWGLIPSWTKDVTKVRNTFNARAERAAAAPTFRAPFKRQRALIPADSFLEWSGAGTNRQPHLFERTDGELLIFAGVWDHWKDPARGDRDDAWIRTCTIITTDAGVDMGQIHNRMPVILEADRWDRWLDRSLDDSDELEAMLQPAPAGTITHRPVSRSFGSIANDGPQLLDLPVET